GVVERSRLRSLLDVELAEPHPPLPQGSWWAHLKTRVRSGSRWREIGYHLLRLPVGAVTTGIALVAWTSALAMLAWPWVVRGFPGVPAGLGVLAVHQAPAAWGAGFVGLVGVVLVAPWITIGLATVDERLAIGLLGARRPDALAERVVQFEASGAAA